MSLGASDREQLSEWKGGAGNVNVALFSNDPVGDMPLLGEWVAPQQARPVAAAR